MTNEKGFSLLEVALLLLVGGILAVPLMEAYNRYMTERTSAKTYTAGSTIQSAMTEFYEMHERYPCPAIPGLAVGDPLHGVEQCPGRDMDGDGTNMAALAFDACTDGFCRTSGRDADGDLADDGVLIGNIPYVSLGIPYNEALDGWKRRFTYAVTESMTDSGTFLPDRGSIMVWKSDGSTPLSYGDAVQSANPKDKGGQATAHFVYFSNGENGRGAYNSEGQRIGDACDNSTFTGAEIAAASKSYNEIENCDNDYEFTTDLQAYSTQAGYDYYDDIFYYQSGLPSGGTWNYSGTQEDVFTSFGGNLGIGTPSPQFAVDVAGNVRAASRTRTGAYCDQTGNNCMPASTIGGSGITCGNTTPMAGIELNDTICEVELPPGAITGECNANEYVTGIDGSGQVICEPIS